MYMKRMHLNQPIHLFFKGGASTNKTFTLMLLIQGFLKHYNRKLSFDPLKQKAILMAYIGKVTFNIEWHYYPLRIEPSIKLQTFTIFVSKKVRFLIKNL